MTFYDNSSLSKKSNRSIRSTPDAFSGLTSKSSGDRSVIGLVADQKRASANRKGTINLNSADNSGLSTTGDNCDTIEINNFRFVTDYVVDSTGENAEYTTLDEALEAANADEKSNSCDGPGVTILLRPGTYELSDKLNNDNKINFVDNAFGTGCSNATIIGQATSGGNKCWFGVKFSDCNGDYFLSTGKDCPQMTDSFCKTEMTDNFRFRTDNHRLKFREVNFNYDCWSRDSVLQVSGGKGIYDDKNSCYTFTRCGGKEDVNKLIQLNVDNTNDRSTIHNSIFNGDIQDSPIHVTISLEGRQELILHNCFFNYNQTIPDECHVLGYYVEDTKPDYRYHYEPEKPNPQYNGQTKLRVYNTDVISVGSSQSNLAVCANLWSGSTEEAIRFHHCSFEVAQVIRNELGVDPGIEGSWQLHKCVSEGNNSSKPLHSSTMNQSNRFRMSLNSSTLRSAGSRAHFVFEQTGTDNTGNFFLVGTAFETAADNIWLENNIDTINTSFAGNGLSGGSFENTVGVAGGTGTNPIGGMLNQALV